MSSCNVARHEYNKTVNPGFFVVFMGTDCTIRFFRSCYVHGNSLQEESACTLKPKKQTKSGQGLRSLAWSGSLCSSSPSRSWTAFCTSGIKVDCRVARATSLRASMHVVSTAPSVDSAWVVLLQNCKTGQSAKSSEENMLSKCRTIHLAVKDQGGTQLVIGD